VRAKVGTDGDGGVTINFPMDGGNGVGMTLTADQAETLGQALLLQAYCARGNTPGEKQWREVRHMRLR
jgi:hypothetical protein